MSQLPNGSNNENVVVLKRNSEARQSGKIVEIISFTFKFLNFFYNF